MNPPQFVSGVTFTHDNNFFTSQLYIKAPPISIVCPLRCVYVCQLLWHGNLHCYHSY